MDVEAAPRAALCWCRPAVSAADSSPALRACGLFYFRAQNPAAAAAAAAAAICRCAAVQPVPGALATGR